MLNSVNRSIKNKANSSISIDKWVRVFKWVKKRKFNWSQGFHLLFYPWGADEEPNYYLKLLSQSRQQSGGQWTSPHPCDSCESQWEVSTAGNSNIVMQQTLLQKRNRQTLNDKTIQFSVSATARSADNKWTCCEVSRGVWCSWLRPETWKNFFESNICIFLHVWFVNVSFYFTKLLAKR